MEKNLTVDDFFGEVESFNREIETRMARLRTLFAHHKAAGVLTADAPAAWKEVESASSALSDRLQEFAIYGDTSAMEGIEE